MRLINLIIIFQIIIVNCFCAQEENKKWELNGYITNMQSVLFDSINKNWYTDNLTHNRLNFYYYPTERITTTVQVRNRFMFGDMIEQKLIVKEDYDEYDGVTDLSWNIADGPSYLFNTTIDRLWFQYTLNNLELKIGRQRINWGQSFVWNPNDIFNTYSFFDFDYPERPGSDAIRLQYYPSYTSKIEAAVKVNKEDEITAAGLFRFSKWSYDIQVLSGILNSEDLVIGTGWIGNINDVSFSGEISYLHPYKNLSDTSGLFFTSINLYYMFSNSLMIQFEGLYNQYAKEHQPENFLEYYSSDLSVKKLSMSEFTVFGQLTYPFNPLINTSVSTMYYFDIKGFVLFPSFDFSLSDHASFSIVAQTFSGEFRNPVTGKEERTWFNLGFLRLKYSF